MKRPSSGIIGAGFMGAVHACAVRPARSGSGSGAPADPCCLLPPGHPQGYQDAFTAFLASTCAAIGGAARDGLPAFSDGLRAARLTAAVLQSATSGDWQVVG